MPIKRAFVIDSEALGTQCEEKVVRVLREFCYFRTKESRKCENIVRNSEEKPLQNR